jgi:hypothetical protein
VSAIVIGLGYQPPLSIPGSGNVLSVRQSVTNLAGGGSTIAPNDKDTNTDTVDDRSTSSPARPRPDRSSRRTSSGAVRMRGGLGHHAGQPRLYSEPSAGLDGLPFTPELAQLISCHLTLSAP